MHSFCPMTRIVNKTILFGILCGWIQFAQAQTGPEIKSIFPQDDVVLLNYNTHLTIKIKDGIPVAESQFESESMFLNNKNVGRYSKYKVFHSSFNELKDLEAYTMVPDGSKYKKIKAGDFKTSNSSSRNVFYDDVKETSFDFAGITENSITHVSYSQFHKDAHLLSPFYFASYLPMVNSSYTVTFPNDIQLKYFVKNDDRNIIRFTEEKNRKETVYTWTAKNINTIEDFNDAPTDQYYQPHVIVYISSYNDKNGSNSFLNTLDDLYKWNVSFTKDLNTNVDPMLKNLVDSLTNGITSEKEKAKNIFKWVQQHIRYVAFEDGIEGFRPRQAADVCGKRYGDCKDMSSIITQMLRIANLKSYYTWIGSRALPYDYTDLHLPLVDDHMISTAFINNEWVFLDATDPNAIYGVPPSHIQGKEALISMNEKEYKVIRVPVAEPAYNLILDSTFINLSDKGIKGYESVYYNGYSGNDVYNALLYRDASEEKDYVKSRMGKASNKFILGDYKINKIDQSQNLVNITAQYEIPDYGKKVGNELYINLNLEKLLEGQLIDTAKRKVPRKIDYKYQIRQYHILEIPAGYKSTYIPQDFTFENNAFRLKISYELKNNAIIAYQEVVNKLLMVQPSQFNEWNTAVKAVLPQYKEVVVLEKK